MTSLEQTFSDIANSIRSKTGSVEMMKPDQMSNAINNITPVSPEVTLYNAQSIISQFNQPVIISNDVTSGYYLFGNYGSFNQPVVIPESVTNCYAMFYNCRNFGSNVYMKCDLQSNNSRIGNMFGYRSQGGSKRVNIYTNCLNTYNALKSTSGSFTSLVGGSITWYSAGTYALYNTLYNLYIYYDPNMTV